MFIEVGTTVKVKKDLNRGIIVQSGNDACVAMAEHIAGSEDAFVDLMKCVGRQPRNEGCSILLTYMD